MPSKIKKSSMLNAVSRGGVNGKEGLYQGKNKGKASKAKEFTDNYKQRTMDLGRPSKFGRKQLEENKFLARNPDFAGKKKGMEFRGDTPIRFNPMEEKEAYAGGRSYESGTFRGGEPNKEINNKYEKPIGRVKPFSGVESVKPTSQSVNPFAVQIKSRTKKI